MHLIEVGSILIKSEHQIHNHTRILIKSELQFLIIRGLAQVGATTFGDREKDESVPNRYNSHVVLIDSVDS